MKKEQYRMIFKWKRDMFLILKERFPNATGEEIDAYLHKVLKKHLKSEGVQFHNSYTNVMYSSTILDITEFIHKKKPTTTEHGTLFDRDAMNPASSMLNKWKAKRKKFKHIGASYPKESYEYKKYDLLQSLEKIKMNSWYGVSGAKTAHFFNLYAATSVTGKGQTLIALATMAYEMFLTNSVPFRNTDECIVFIKNIIREKPLRAFNDCDVLERDCDVHEVFNRIQDTFEDVSKCRKDIIMPMLLNLSQEDLNRIYYKNNIYEFSRNKKIKALIKDVVATAEVFNNPNDVPEYLKPYLDELWQYTREYVFYNYPILDRGHRLQTQKRKTVVVIDTDSNMLNLNPWYEFVIEEVLDDDIITSKEPTILRHIILYTLAFNLGNMISEVLQKFMKVCNVKKENRKLMDMKNEFLFSKMIITDGKKNYASSIEFKEGKDMGDKLDVKGLAINKSVTNKKAAKVFKGIVHDDILKSEQVNFESIINKLHKLETDIRQSFVMGRQDYLKPISVKDISAYENPFGEMQVVAMVMWNTCYPDKPIIPPENFFIIKTKMLKKSDLDKIKDIEPEIYNNLLTEIFEGPNEKLAKKGLYVIGLPRSENKIPDWLLPFLDVETMTDDILKAILPVLEATGLQTIHSGSTKSHYSNIIPLA